jgi:hypothetical protein
MQQWEYAVLEFENDTESDSFISVDMERELHSYGSDGYELKSVNVAGEKIYIYMMRPKKLSKPST